MNPKDIRARFDRHRRRLTPEEQRVIDERGRSKFHDVLVIGPTKPDELTRVPVVKAEGSIDQWGNPEPAGSYRDPPEIWDAYDYGFRRTMSIAKPQDWCPPSDVPRGPAFGTLPVKREPASTACVACYLIDARNFTHHNAWTAEEWNDIGSDDLLPASSADDDTLEVLVAGPRGKVFYLDVTLANGATNLWDAGDTEAFVSSDRGSRGSITCVDLRYEGEIWNQLRNGLVAGSVMTQSVKRPGRDSRTAVPIVNMTSLLPDPDLLESAKGGK